jgi:hypothetical protein
MVIAEDADDIAVIKGSQCFGHGALLKAGNLVRIE